MSRAEVKDGLRVLSFDGPPFPEAGLSELFILQQIAHRWAFNEEEEDEMEGDDVRVSDMFDMVGGCGLGGLYAILFARLNMTIGQVIQFHNILKQQLFTADCWTDMDHQECTKALDDALDQLVHSLGVSIDLNSPFLSKDCTKCLVVVLNKTTTNTLLPRLLRSYRVRIGSSPRCTIRQAFHATLADLKHLPAVTIGVEHFMSTTNVFSNSTRIYMKDLAATFPKLHLACLMNVGADRTNPPNDSLPVSQDLMALFQTLGCFFRLSVREELNNQSEIMSFVMGYMQEDVISKISDDIVDALKDRKRVVNVLRIGDLAGEDGKHELRAGISHLCNEGEIKRALERLRGPFDFPSLHEHGCLEGTRVDVLEHIDSWVNDFNAPNVFWLEGYPGTGKTFISISLKQRLAETGLLGASCFFRREDASHHRLDTLVRSIAFQLSDKHGFIRETLAQVVNSGVAKFEGAPGNLFAQLIYDPLTATCADLDTGIVILLDALDEFGQSDNDQLHLLTLLLPRWTQLPSRCKLFIASRSQGVIPRHLNLPAYMIQRLEIGYKASTETLNDIRTFFKHNFETIKNSFNSSTSLVTDSELEALVNASAGLFIWASTAIQMVKQKTLRKAAKRVLRNLCTQHAMTEPARMQPLYQLYRTVLTPLLNSGESHVVDLPPDELLARETFFAALARARIPLSASALASLCKTDVEDIQDIVQQLTPVMDSVHGLRFVHKSFTDYVTSQDFPFQLNLDAVELAFTDSCLKIMHAQLHFNMGKMPSSHMLNSEIPKLHETLSEELRYASQFWGSHFMSIQNHDKSKAMSFARPIDDFLTEKFLYWVEAVSILGCFREAKEVLLILKTAGFGKDICDFAQDALTFIRQFALPISQSYPHIYISAVPWVPTTSLIRERYLNVVPHALRIVSHGDKTWPAQLAVIQGHNDAVISVAFSPDGTQIISGSNDNTIRIWDAATGQPIGEPLRGHSDAVNSVAFSPDSSLIVSGSNDKTIRIWHAGTCQPTGEPIQGHTSTVESVAFSPNGAQIVSGSHDNTIRIWDAATHQPIGNPIRGHTSSVTSVAFSHDGSQILSGSCDKTIQIWDATTRQPIGNPIRGHNGSVLSVAFSPDTSRIVSGSYDKTLRIWDATTGQLIGEPVHGHTHSVSSVSFSPDGSRIVSGSYDDTIQTWDTTAPQPIEEPLRGHTSLVTSVAFSPDGSQIVSGSYDKTIRIWNVATCQPIRKPFRGHTNSVLSVAFSPDGSQIVSGSSDDTIRIWNAATRRPIGRPFRGHTHSVESVAFSPNGSQIVSGSYDRTIRIWNAATCRPIGEPLRGHTDSVLSVAISPDGSQIVSGSYDKTIRIWDAATCKPIGEPLCGHKNSVTSVAFSPDGTRIVSASYDRTIQIWDTTTHKLIGKPFRYHNGSVRSVAFSPDGSQIVSQPIGKHLIEYLATASCVAFSPNSSQIVSGSWDNTLCIWDAATRHSVREPVQAMKPLFFPRVSNSIPLDCFLLKNGWVIDQHNRRLIWIPQHLHKILPTPGLIDILSPRRMVVIDASEMRTGTEWSSCVRTE